MELRSILDWRIAPRLKEVPGVVEVNSFGGELKTYEVQIRPDTLVAYKLTLSEVFHALEKNNLSAGGGYIIHNGEQQVIRGAGLVSNLTDIGNIVVGTRNEVPVYIRNLGSIALAPMLRQGAVTRDGKGETVAGIVMLLIGENSAPSIPSRTIWPRAPSWFLCSFFSFLATFVQVSSWLR